MPNEFAALLTDLRLIQHDRPLYNVRHARHPQYCFVKLTREPAPRLVVVTRAAGDDAVYFGPFPGTRQVGRAVLELCRALGLRDCPASTPVFFADPLEIFNEGRAPRCLRGALGNCLAPCAGRPTAARYSERARDGTSRAEASGHSSCSGNAWPRRCHGSTSSTPVSCATACCSFRTSATG